METHPVSETLCYLEYRTTKFKNSIILSAMDSVFSILYIVSCVYLFGGREVRFESLHLTETIQDSILPTILNV
jgi:hypothetical protein